MRHSCLAVAGPLPAATQLYMCSACRTQGVPTVPMGPDAYFASSASAYSFHHLHYGARRLDGQVF
jgi:hypothetical protein